MSGPDHPDAPPPEVPEEFAAAYRAAYRRALESGQASGFDDLPDVPPQQVTTVGTHPSPDADDQTARPRWLVPALAAGGALVLVLAAYAVGAALSDDDGEAGPQVRQTSGAGPTDRPGGSASASPSRSADDDLAPVTVDAISTDCTAPPSRDSAGRRVTYVPANAVDGEAETAWRCPGTAVGERLTLRFAADADVAAVGLVPGYAKTDPESGVDRFEENNRVTRVRWTFGTEGESVVQRLDPSSRELQVLEVPRTDTDEITLEILAVERGPRNTTAISEIAVLTSS